jgi:hypothetical protein
MRVAITDFGLATTDRFSEEFRTGSVYHMSPGNCSNTSIVAYTNLYLRMSGRGIRSDRLLFTPIQRHLVISNNSP